MNISFYGGNLLKHLFKSLEDDGHHILFNQFSTNVDLVICQSHTYIYDVYKNLNKIKRHKIKLINVILDVPLWRLEKSFNLNSISRLARQTIYNGYHKYNFINKRANFLFSQQKGARNKYYPINLFNRIVNTQFRNKVFYQLNYRNFLKKSDLNLSISKYTQYLAKRFLKLGSKVWYLSADSELIKNLPRNLDKKYDAINISRIVKIKRQEIFVEAANRLKLKIAVIGPHYDKSIKLNCPHFPLSHEKALKAIIQSDFYVDPSIFEGFGLTPVEAAFLNKITIASDTVIHREILRDYPLYFKRDNVEDLIEKMKLVKENGYSLNNKANERIKKKYSVQTAKNLLLEYIQSII
ncbi:MAG: glycosyltransferase [Promethearchaeota archaeon]